MKPFDIKAKCPKCGHAEVGVVYAKEENNCDWDHRIEDEPVEHLDRCCALCGYEWPEAVLSPEPEMTSR